jgi:primosomal replication protein N
MEAGREREVTLTTEIAAFGPVAEGLAQVEPGKPIRLIGFLDRKGANQLELHVTEFVEE